VDWTKLGAWVYENNPVDLAKIAKYKIGTVYVDPRSGNAATVTAQLRAAGVTPGIYFDPHWDGGNMTPQQHAGVISNYVQHTGLIEPGEPVMLDMEALSIPWVANFLEEYRDHLPERPTAYTNAPFQNQTVVPVNALKTYGLHWYPQTYYGDMSPADTAAVMLEVARIYPPDMVHPFYDGAHLPADARDGAVFTLERLP
jgi:hypothetical protein